MGVKLSFCLHTVLAAEEMLFALQLWGCAKHRPKLSGSPSNAGRWVRFLCLLVQPLNSPNYWKPRSHFQAPSSCRTHTAMRTTSALIWVLDQWAWRVKAQDQHSRFKWIRDVNYRLQTLLRHFFVFVSGLGCPCTHALCWKRATTRSYPACFLQEKTSAFPGKVASMMPTMAFLGLCPQVLCFGTSLQPLMVSNPWPSALRA